MVGGREHSRIRARGFSAGGDAMKRIAVGFDGDTFDQINASANGLTFAERVRQLVELGLESEKQESGRRAVKS
jgi:hypothetical protein